MTPQALAKAEATALRVITESDDAEKIRNIMESAKRLGSEPVREAAFRKLIHLLPEEDPGTFEHDFWQTIHAFEEVLRDERGKTVRLSRTRQKITRVGIRRTLEDFATASQATDGFRMLIERGMPELTGEAIVLRHSESFPDDVVAAARNRLLGANVDITALKKCVSWS
ncbi:hypothetical protein DFR52_10640 [Hoeflea marina]|uniref:Uncharacterized protein n=1 Tax=Hoeflea marina TaxID=274592 RepID=A0A317PIV2_9HYPH|nr:hypothetical protein [Hoeflea marina]PWV97517.1 hypothetical protein DFR52_10640 [Hoeflea marina]